MHATILEINQQNLKYNVAYFKKKIKSDTRVLAVIKAYAYGSDAVLVAKAISNQVNYFAVAYTKEGIELVKNRINKPIIVLHAQIENYPQIIDNNLEPNIYSFRGLRAFINEAKTKKVIKYPIHLKFNTGLNRLGFTVEDIPLIMDLVKNNNTIHIKSIFSHLVASEDIKEKDFTLNQINQFQNIKKNFEGLLNDKPIFHLLNTSGVVNYPNAQFDMVRIGIGLLGFSNDEEENKKLKNVLALKSKISQIHKVKKGESIGYNRAYFMDKDGKTATIPIGHADGISRKLGNKKGFVYVGNQKVPIIGNVCMDMIMIDVTNVNCNEGDEVWLFKNHQDVNAICEILQTIPYEFFTMLSQRIERVML